MKIKEFDEVLLKDGRKAAIVEVFSDSDFLADVGEDSDSWDTIFLSIDEVEKVL
jgi:hypothetical protein